MTPGRSWDHRFTFLPGADTSRHYRMQPTRGGSDEPDRRSPPGHAAQGLEAIDQVRHDQRDFAGTLRRGPNSRRSGRTYRSCPRSRAKLDQYEEEIALLLEEMRIKDARWSAIPAQQRPRYAPTERLAILELSGGPRLVAGADGQAVSRHRRDHFQLAAARRRRRARARSSSCRSRSTSFPRSSGYLVQRLKSFAQHWANARSPRSWPERLAPGRRRPSRGCSPSLHSPASTAAKARAKTRRQSASSRPSGPITSGTSI